MPFTDGAIPIRVVVLRMQDAQTVTVVLGSQWGDEGKGMRKWRGKFDEEGL